MSRPTIKTLEFSVGADVSITFVHADGVDMTAWALAFAILDTYDGTVQHVVTTAGGGIVAAGSIATISLLSADLFTVGAGEWVYTFSRTDAGSKDVPAAGPFNLGPPMVYVAP